eukprot:TRINITY_DN7077_c0_g1_i1.p1 TRINITY_DN7077_c0_g1~~TRINITY_DN7077_c0_g1_i1.p1  ORF type:complete len:1169 (+),score=251.36 TRINITY_DN7077_c0_g1_i1:2-3508(+)
MQGANEAGTPLGWSCCCRLLICATSFIPCLKSHTQMHREHMKKTVEVTTLKDLIEGPTALEYFCSEAGQENVLLGMRNGSMQMYNISSALCGLRVTLPVAMRYRAHSRPDLLQHKGPSVYRDKAPSLEGSDTAITKIRVAKHLQAALTASWDGTVKIINIETGNTVRDLVGHEKSVFTLDWSEAQRIIATCGSERHVLIWNPFMKKPIFSLVGHASPLMGVQFNDDDHQIVTVGYDQCCKIWDVRTFRCMQSFTLYETQTGGKSATGALALNYDYKDHSIVLGSTFPTSYTMKRAVTGTGLSRAYDGHTLPVVDALVGKGGRLISADSEAVMVWDVATGRRLFSFDAASGLPRPQSRITSISLDDSGKRLMTGAHNGSMMLWNHANGQPLNEYKGWSKVELVDTDSESGEGDEGRPAEDIRFATQYGDPDCPPANRSVLVIKGNAKEIACYADHSDFTVREQGAWEVADEATTLCSIKMGKYLLMGTDCGSICVFNADTLKFEGRPLRIATSPAVPRLSSILQHHPLQRGKYSIVALALLELQREKHLAACTSDGYLELWDVRRRMIVHLSRLLTIDNTRGDRSRSFGLQGDGDDVQAPQIASITADEGRQRLFVAYVAGTVQVIDLASLNVRDARDPTLPPPATSFMAQGGRLSCVQYSAKHDLLALGGSDCSLKVYTPSGALLGSLGVHQYSVDDKSTWQSATETATVVPPPPSLEPEGEDFGVGRVYPSGVQLRKPPMATLRSLRRHDTRASVCSPAQDKLMATPRSTSSSRRGRNQMLNLDHSETDTEKVTACGDSSCDDLSQIELGNTTKTRYGFIPKLSHNPSRKFPLHVPDGAQTDRPATHHSVRRAMTSRDGSQTARAPKPPKGRYSSPRGFIGVLEDSQRGIGDPDPRKLLRTLEHDDGVLREKEACIRPSLLDDFDVLPAIGDDGAAALRDELVSVEPAEDRQRDLMSDAGDSAAEVRQRTPRLKSMRSVAVLGVDSGPEMGGLARQRSERKPESRTVSIDFASSTGSSEDGTDTDSPPKHGLTIHEIEERIAKLHRSGFTSQPQRRDRASRMTLQQALARKDINKTAVLNANQQQATSLVDSVWNTLPCPAPRETPAALKRTVGTRLDFDKIRALQHAKMELSKDRTHMAPLTTAATKEVSTRIKWTNEDLRSPSAR